MTALLDMAPLKRVCLAVKMNIRTRQKSEAQEAPGAKGKLAWQEVPSQHIYSALNLVLY